jgi:hypothetical protein
MRIKDVLGSYYYDIILAKYNAQTLSQLETEMVEIIQNSLIWRAASDIAITTSFQMTNKGIQSQNGDFSVNSSESSIFLISKHYAQKAEWFESRLINFIRLNKTQMPDYTNTLNRDSSITDIIPSVDKPYNRDITIF